MFYRGYCRYFRELHILQQFLLSQLFHYKYSQGFRFASDIQFLRHYQHRSISIHIISCDSYKFCNYSVHFKFLWNLLFTVLKQFKIIFIPEIRWLDSVSNLHLFAHHNIIPHHQRLTQNLPRINSGCGWTETADCICRELIALLWNTIWYNSEHATTNNIQPHILASISPTYGSFIRDRHG